MLGQYKQMYTPMSTMKCSICKLAEAFHLMYIAVLGCGIVKAGVRSCYIYMTSCNIQALAKWVHTVLIKPCKWMCIFQYTRVLNLASVVTFPCWHSSRDEFCIIKKITGLPKLKKGETTEQDRKEYISSVW